MPRNEVKGLKELQNDLARISKGLIDKKLLTNIGFLARLRILQRTNKGLDYKHRAFKPYSTQYKDFRKEKGRQVSRVDLQFSRRMLQNITVKTQEARDLVKLVFTRGEERQKAFYHTEVGVGKSQVKREFFSLSKKDEKEIDGMIDKHIKDILK